MPDWKKSLVLLAILAAIAISSRVSFVAGRESAGESAPQGSSEKSEGTETESIPDVLQIVGLADPVERSRRFLALLGQLDASQFPAVADELQGQSDEWAEVEARLFIWAWSRHDPAAALARALVWSPNMRDVVGFAAARSWARRNPIAAREAVRVELETEIGTLGPSLMSGVAHGWAENGDFEGALEFIDERFSALAHRETLVEMLVQQMLEANGLPSTFSWAEGLAARHDDRAFLSIVFRKVGRNAIRIDPVATSAWLDRFDGDPSYMDRARRAASVAWGHEDPRAALAWMLAQPRANVRRVSGLTAILVDWVMREESAALEWLRTTPADDGLDDGVSLAALRIAERSPRSAIEWVELVRDPTRREEVLVSVVARWQIEDEAGAKQWLASQARAAALSPRVDATVKELEAAKAAASAPATGLQPDPAIVGGAAQPTRPTARP